MSTCPIVENLRRSTIACFERGETSAELFAQADRQDAANNPFSADCTRAIAQGVKRLEEDRDAAKLAKLAGTSFTVIFRQKRSNVIVRVFGTDNHWDATAHAQDRVGSATHIITIEGKPDSWSPSLAEFIEIVI
jgi:hypothetical protein